MLSLFSKAVVLKAAIRLSSHHQETADREATRWLFVLNTWAGVKKETFPEEIPDVSHPRAIQTQMEASGGLKSIFKKQKSLSHKHEFWVIYTIQNYSLTQ